MTILQGLGQIILNNWDSYSIKEQRDLLTELATNSYETAAKFVQSIDSDQLKLRIAVKLACYDAPHLPHPVLGIIQQLANKELKKSICERISNQKLLKMKSSDDYESNSKIIQLYLQVGLVEKACQLAVDTVVSYNFMNFRFGGMIHFSHLLRGIESDDHKRQLFEVLMQGNHYLYATDTAVAINDSKIQYEVIQQLLQKGLIEEAARVAKYLSSDLLKKQVCLQLIQLDYKKSFLTVGDITNITEKIERDEIVLEICKELEKENKSLAIEILGTLKNEELKFETIKLFVEESKDCFDREKLFRIAKKANDDSLKADFCKWMFQKGESFYIQNVALQIKDDQLKYEVCCFLIANAQGENVDYIGYTLKNEDLKFKLCEALIKIGKGTRTECLGKSFEKDEVKLNLCKLLIEHDLTEAAKKYASKWKEDEQNVHTMLIGDYQRIAKKIALSMHADKFKEDVCYLINKNTPLGEEVYEPIWKQGTTLVVDIASTFSDETLKFNWCQLLIARKKEFYAGMLTQNINSNEIKYQACKLLVKTEQKSEINGIAESFKDDEYRLKLVMLLIMSTSNISLIKSVVSTIKSGLLRYDIQEMFSDIKHNFQTGEWTLKEVLKKHPLNKM